MITLTFATLIMFLSGVLMGIAITGLEFKHLHPSIGIPFAFAFMVGMAVVILIKIK